MFFKVWLFSFIDCLPLALVLSSWKGQIIALRWFLAMLTRLLLVLFSCLVFQQKCLADESYGYLRKDGFPKITCTTDPLPGECSFEYEVVSSRMTQSQAGASTGIALLKQTIGGDMGPTNSSNELCVKTVRDYMCKKSFQFTCTDEYILQDIHGVKTSCKEVEKYCVNATGILSNLLNRMVNCSMAIPPVERIKRHTLKCERFPDVKDDPFPCAKRNYKVRFSVWFFNFTFFVHMCRLYNNRSQRSVYFSVCAIYIPICLMCNCVGSVGNKLLSHAPEVKRKSKPSRKHISWKLVTRLRI